MITLKQTMENGISELLSSVVEDVGEAVTRNISGAQLLHDLLSAPWLCSLLKIYECLLQFQRLTPSPLLPYASGLLYEIMTIIQRAHHPSAEARELYNLLSSPHFLALLSSHDSVAQFDYLPVLPPLPDELPEDEEAIRIVCLVKNNQPLSGNGCKSVEEGVGVIHSRWNSLRRLTLEHLIPGRRDWSGEDLRMTGREAGHLPPHGHGPFHFLPCYELKGSSRSCLQTGELCKQGLNHSSPAGLNPDTRSERPGPNKEDNASSGGSSDDYSYPPPPIPAYSGATIRRDEVTGDIYIARVIHGGLADRSGLLHPSDLLVEVNGISVVGLEPERVIQILNSSIGTILFKVIPRSTQVTSCQKPVYMRAMVDYYPRQDSSIPCPDAGMAFSKGDLLEVVDQSDALWWQARKLPCTASFAGLIPSASMLRSKYKEQWWCHPSQVHTCIRPYSLTDNVEDPTHADSKKILTDMENNKEINFDEADSDITEGIYLAGFRRSFRLWKRMSYKRRRQSCTSCSPSNNALSSPYEEVALFQRLPQEDHRLILLIGASGVGVNELRKRLIKLNPSTFQGPVPHTTRPMKEGEQAGREYHFVTKELFEYMVCNRRFVEYGESKSHLYGTSIDAIDEVLKRGRMCIIDVETQSTHLLRLRNLKPYVIFIKAPSPETLRQTRRNSRIITSYAVNRAFTEEDFVELEDTSQLIEAKYKQYFDSVVVNGDLQDACMELCSIIQQAQNEPQWIPVSWLHAEE